MTKTSARCDRIIALIDACLADVGGPAGSTGRPGSTGSPASCNARFVPCSPASSVASLV